jgi:hypothetical protein
VIAQNGKMYSIDNGANSGWGDLPQGNATANCTNAAREPGSSDPDNLHVVTAGFYAGHPNPTRGNASNKFNSTNPQSPVPSSNSVECTYKEPGVSDGALATFANSTNGLAEYTASHFGGQMKGDLLAAGWDNKIWRIELNSAGTAVSRLTTLFTSVAEGSKPLDLIAQGDGGPFPGTIWATDYNNGAIIVYEPAGSSSCSGLDSDARDDDADGFDNADEIDNGTSPCSAADTPPDADGDHDSDLNDPDDDNDGAADSTDAFALDAQNGRGTDLPVRYSWENGDPSAGGILGLGFTGLMTNGVDDYEALFDPDGVTAGGAAGVLTIDMVPGGDALGTLNSQQYGLQLGVDVTAATAPFTAHTRIVAPFAGAAPEDFQSMGLFVGTGRQNSYVKITTAARGGSGGVELTREVNDAAALAAAAPVAMPGPDYVDLYLTVDPGDATVQARYAVTTGGVTAATVSLGAPQAVPSSWFTSATTGLAVGIISTSRGAAPAFPATWDFVRVESGGP